MLSRKTAFRVNLAVAAALYGLAFWIASIWGALWFFVTLLVLIPVHAYWISPLLPEVTPPTEAERQAEVDAWTGFFDRLFWPVGPTLIAGWLLLKWLERP